VLGAAALAAAALTASGCASSGGNAPIAPLTMSAGAASSGPAGVTDIQILHSLEMTGAGLDAAFGTTGVWHEWSPTTQDKDSIGYTGFLKCKAGLDSTGSALSQAVSTFSADSLPTDKTSSGGTSSTKGKTTTSKKKGTSPSTSSSGTPKHWVISIAAVYKDDKSAKTAALSVGKLDLSNNSLCGKPTDAAATTMPTYIGGQIGETEPTWYGEDPTVGFVVTKTNSALTAVAQQRGRFVVVTITGGTASLKNGYYSLNSIDDTDTAAEAATSMLSQLTNAVVNGS